MKNKKYKKIFLLLVGILMFVAIPLSAATFKAGETYELKNSNTISGDAYIAGGYVDISGNIVGDGLIAGGNISVIGDITEDVILVGGTVGLFGNVGDDARIIGGDVTVSSNVSGDLIAIGGFVKILSDSTISGDTVVLSRTSVISGVIAGDLTIYGGKVEINGVINGNVNLKLTESVTIGEDASITGNLTYSAKEEIEIPEGVFIGGEVKRIELPIKNFQPDFKNILGFLLLGKFLLMVVAGIFAVLVFRRFSEEVGDKAVVSFWKNTLIGLITLIVVPIVTLLLFLSLFGVYIGLVLLMVYMLMLFIAKVYVGIIAGAILSKWVRKEVIVDWKWVVLGITVTQALILIPVVGISINFFLLLASFGTLGLLVYRGVWLNR